MAAKHQNEHAANEITIDKWPDTVEKESFLNLRKMVALVLEIVLPMDKANAVITLSSDGGKDWISKKQLQKVQALPQYVNKLTPGHNLAPMGRKLVELVELFELHDLHTYIQPQLLNCSSSENEHLARNLSKANLAEKKAKPKSEDEQDRAHQHKYTDHEIDTIIQIQSYARRKLAVLQVGCLKELSRLYPRLTFWQSQQTAQVLQHLENGKISMATNLLHQLDAKI